MRRISTTLQGMNINVDKMTPQWSTLHRRRWSNSWKGMLTLTWVQEGTTSSSQSVQVTVVHSCRRVTSHTGPPTAPHTVRAIIMSASTSTFVMYGSVPS